MKPIYSHDRTAPRMRKGEFSKMVITKELYKKFLRQFPEYEKMTWKEFYDSWLEIAEMIRHEAVYNPLGTKLGSYTGELKLQYLPYKYKAIDDKLSEEIGERTHYLNLTEKGKVAKMKWERRKAVKFNKILQYYAFDATRELVNLAGRYVRDNPEKLRVARAIPRNMTIWSKIHKK